MAGPHFSPLPKGAGAAQPLFEVTRGRIVESVHYGSIAVVDSNGKLMASYGDPKAVVFLRSSAKPFQAIPFVEHGGVELYGFTPRELSIACASHEGSDLHVQTIEAMQKKAGLEESHLQCGTHMPGDVDAFKSLVRSSQLPGPNRNNCSGKHTAMLAYAKMGGHPLETYLEITHPIQQDCVRAHEVEPLGRRQLLPVDPVERGQNVRFELFVDARTRRRMFRIVGARADESQERRNRCTGRRLGQRLCTQK